MIYINSFSVLQNCQTNNCISETRLKAESIMKINLPGYTFIDAKISSNASGVGIYITNR